MPDFKIYTTNNSDASTLTAEQEESESGVKFKLYPSNSSGAMSMTIEQVGEGCDYIASPASPSSGDFLVYNGSAWVAMSLSTWQGGSY